MLKEEIEKNRQIQLTVNGNSMLPILKDCNVVTIERCDKYNITSDMFDTNLIDLGMDSIKFIHLIVALEEEFECEIPDSKILIPEMDTIEKIIGVLQTLYDEEISSVT